MRAATNTPVEDRFWVRVVMKSPDDCWEWLGGHYHGYALFGSRTPKINTQAHRFVFALLGWRLAKGEEVHHLCANRGCVNPNHLEIVTSHSAHIRLRHRATYCKRGHDLAVTARIESGEKRRCRACEAIRRRTPEYRAKHAADERRRRRNYVPLDNSQDRVTMQP